MSEFALYLNFGTLFVVTGALFFDSDRSSVATRVVGITLIAVGVTDWFLAVVWAVTT